MNGLVLFESREGIAVLTLNRPEKRNALNLSLWGEMEDHLATIEAAAETIGAVILQAAGPVFCAGNDLKERGAALPRPDYQSSIISRLADLPQPVIVAVQGGCYTGGLELALAGDIILAAESAAFADTHGKFGLVPIWGMSQRLPRRVGPWHARELSLTGRTVNGPEAERIGLANHCVRDDALQDRARDLAQATAAQSRHSVFAYKRLYRAQADMPLAAGLAYEVACSAGAAPDSAGRIAASFARPPR